MRNDVVHCNSSSKQLIFCLWSHQMRWESLWPSMHSQRSSKGYATMVCKLALCMLFTFSSLLVFWSLLNPWTVHTLFQLDKRSHLQNLHAVACMTMGYGHTYIKLNALYRNSQNACLQTHRHIRGCGVGWDSRSSSSLFSLRELLLEGCRSLGSLFYVQGSLLKACIGLASSFALPQSLLKACRGSPVLFSHPEFLLEACRALESLS